MNLLELFVKIGVDDQATSRIADIGDGIKSGLGTAAKVGGAAVAAIGAAATGATAAISGAATQVAEYGDSIDKMSQKMGMSAEAYQEWDAVMQHSGTSMETMKASMKTLANAAETDNDAFQKLGLTQEQIASMSQEELFEATIAGLQNVTDTTERTYLAGQLLGRGATELGALLNTSAEDTQAMRDRVHELGGVMSDEAVKASARFQDSLQDMQTAMSGLKRNMMAEFLPGMADVMDGLANIFSGDTEGGAEQVAQGVENIVGKLREGIPKFVEVVRELAPVLITALVEVVTTLAQEIPNLVVQLVPVLLDLTPTIVEAGLQMFLGLVKALTDSGPALMDKVVDTIFQVAEVLVDYAPQILEASLLLFAAILEALVQKLPEIIQGVVDLVMRMVDSLVSHAPDILAAAGQLMAALVQGIIDAVGSVVDAIGQVGQSILDGIAGFFQSVYDAGANLIGGFIQGIVDNISGVGRAIMDGVGGAIDGAKRMLGIASPSKVFAEIGKNTMLGLEGGIDGELGGLRASMKLVNDSIRVDDPSFDFKGGRSLKNASSALNMTVYVESREDDPYEQGRLIGQATAYELRMQGVCA